MCVCVCMYVGMARSSVHNFDPIQLKFGMEVYFAPATLGIGPDPPSGFAARPQKVYKHVTNK